MADKITVTSKNSYGSRVKNSFAKIGLWFILVILSIIWIFKNEQNFLETKVALNEWAEVVQETISTEINPELDQAEVHLYGETNSPMETLSDAEFWVIVGDLKLQRNVQMYQWTEKSEEDCSDNMGGSETCETTYSYEKHWVDYPIESNDFYQSAWHENPAYWEYESQEREKSPIFVWVYRLADTFVSDLTNYNTLNLTSQDIIVPEKYQQNENMDNSQMAQNDVDNIQENNDSYLYWNDEIDENVSKSTQNFYIHDTYIYIGSDETSPQIWDLKITFSTVKTWTVSVIWQQLWDTLTSYMASNGKTIALLSQGTVSAEQMFANAQKANKTWTRIFRWLLLLLMYVWFAMMLEFITTLAKVIPFLSKLIGVWTGVIAFALTLVFGFLAFGISRLAVRPVAWICCLVVVIAWIVLLVRARKGKKSPDKWSDSAPKDDKDIEIVEV